MYKRQNIFGLTGTVNHYRITYDSSKKDTFNVHTQHGIVKFKRNKDGLYTYKPLPCYYKEVKEHNEGVNQMITTVTKKKTGFTKRQVEDAKTARKLYHSVGCPTVQNFKAIL